ncbi:50S ribosomal protein L31 [endosymbiont of Sipalinus gigas]|uniref:50S ribosomal protein L31 n=1 Tax=endosymbiont of Sipalinus gigas TaxID=1972134 RepID=UPI000DC6DE7F|nr:50S ribosomal protein L31 [endosymbiont of Sipalinus gigas]BBA85321.1 50S ribosomal protein L31 [endosymbiont of Sipalinus gigas]
MKKIHPKINKILFTCSCGNKKYIWSILVKDINTDVCNICHSFYTGKQKINKNIGRIKKFNIKFN